MKEIPLMNAASIALHPEIARFCQVDLFAQQKSHPLEQAQGSLYLPPLSQWFALSELARRWILTVHAKRNSGTGQCLHVACTAHFLCHRYLFQAVNQKVLYLNLQSITLSFRLWKALKETWHSWTPGGSGGIMRVYM